MRFSDAVRAIRKQDIFKLRQFARLGTSITKIGKHMDVYRWNLLHHAVMTRNLEVVKIVMQYFKPNRGQLNFSRMTPLMLACLVRCPVELIIYMIERSQAFQKDVHRSPLAYAVAQNRVKLARAITVRGRILIPRTVIINSIRVVLLRTCSSKMLRCLLDALKVRGHTFKDWSRVLEQHVTRIHCPLAKKIACFEKLFNEFHPNAHLVGPARYNVNDILKFALLSTRSNSLVPYFIKAELKWETRAPVVSLYERLVEKYELLALAVLCEYGPVTVERKELDVILLDYGLNILLESGGLGNMYEAATRLTDDGQTSIQLLEDFTTFIKTMQSEFLRNFLRYSAFFAYCARTFRFDVLYHPSYHRAADCMMILYGDACTESIILYTMLWHRKVRGSIIIYSLLKHCTWPLMFPHFMYNILPDKRLFSWIMHLFGSWKSIQQLVGPPVFELFTLKRLARDVIRESVYLAVSKKNPTLMPSLLELLDIPEELIKYLRFYDASSINYFVKQAESLKRLTKEEVESGLPYPIII